MKEAVSAPRFDAKQQVQKPRQPSRFPRFVRAVDDMQVGSVSGLLAKGDGIIREDAVADKIQPIDTHQASPPPVMEWRRAATSSAPSEANSARASWKALS